jgi:hypothetical protein
VIEKLAREAIMRAYLAEPAAKDDIRALISDPPA